MQKFIQTPNVLVILLEELNYRQIHLDGRALPKDPDPSFMGYSVGRWEGDTLVAESTGFKDRIWLDLAGHPITDTLRITERFHRLDFGHMEIAETIDDPKTFKKSFTIVIKPGTRSRLGIPGVRLCGKRERPRSTHGGKALRSQMAAAVAPQYSPDMLVRTSSLIQKTQR
jgi:hypothetical protein